MQSNRAIDWEHPPEDPEGGCPGAWRSCPWVWSVVRYARKPTEGGGHDPNPYHDQLDVQTHPVLVAAVAYYEHEADRAHAHRMKRGHDARRDQMESKH